MRLRISLRHVLTGAALLLLTPVAETKQQGHTQTVTGVVNNGVQQRLELQVMQTQNPDQFNLYLLGLREFMAMDQNNPISYYQIAGIHGRPYIAWDGWTSAAGPGGYGGGYACHVSNIFLPWHRPYLAFFEQQLYNHVQNVANSFPASSRARWQSAATNFRIPYWDWAAAPSPDCQVFPNILSTQTITLTTPTGLKKLPNPLYSYDFHPLVASDMAISPYTQWKTTVRDPTGWTASGVSQNGVVGSSLSRVRSSLTQRVYNLFTGCSNFTRFSNEAWQGTDKLVGADSLESIHDVIHTTVGSNGHMTYFSYSAFDPIFWLHHANVDRLWAMWSEINPNTYVQTARAGHPTFTWPTGTAIDANFGLVPWAKSRAGALYTSNDVRGTDIFGYTYPETAEGFNATSVKKAVNSLYGNDANQHAIKAPVQSSSYQYIANFVSQKMQLSGSYAIYVFLGKPGANPQHWPTASNLVGTHAVTADFNVETTEAAVMDLPVTGTVPLTDALQAKVNQNQLASMDMGPVETYLQQHLNWRISLYDGTVVPASKVPGFSISVVASEMQPAAAADEFPTWGPFISLSNATFSG
ncbi:hypothetical protein ANO11243_075690 [Dothideomycetidae sp. 11243]|nr:hypothetical protein ANO11243_075690 [fungal sp. No.11243]